MPLTMIPWELLDSATVPGTRGELGLYSRDGEFLIRVNREELMNSRAHGSATSRKGDSSQINT